MGSDGGLVPVSYKLVIAVRSDVRMGPGKLAAQVAHAAVSAVLSSQETPQLLPWLHSGQAKVVVRVRSLDDLEDRVRRARLSNVAAMLVADAGRTEVEPGTVTCCAFGPDTDEALAPITGDLPLL
ncbi:MAG: peptidyl-tRNA hydrolase Pth2 [Chloroflexota bacterium]